MRKVIMWNMVTLDGLFEGPDRDISWFAFDDELEKYILKSQESADTLLFGRVTYQLMADYWPTAEGQNADFMNSVPKVVFSRTLAKADWSNTRLVKDGVPEEIARLKQQSGGDIFILGSADVSSTVIRHGLVDEYRCGINPVVLGRGTLFFKGGHDHVDLKLLDGKPLNSGLVVLHYEPARKQ